ncbi:high-affinity nicotinic acid transporter [Diaporthe amygdali]|uniref:high-affinity nicotinic acid transporter n=1 Tax=Phomopsis amygdali TaxID=1214568 RepID=UPI0022FF0459|nr:high-affinity nicotinic acid transporter [Diaporthe amygdali]KAJ0108205.1 high-affinity nicotinic acid transporter [Diaporthe amygdali]
MSAKQLSSPSNLSATDPEQDDHKASLKSAHRKVDRRLVLWYSFVYLIMRIHVSNISNTAIINLEEGDGIKAQLGGLTSQQWAWVLSIFYYPYMLLEPFATLALKRFTPRLWMARIMVTWGIVTYAISFMNGVGGLAGWRWVFILEGLPAIFCGIYTFFFLPDYPETAAFLSEAEKQALVVDLPARAPSMASKTFDLGQIKATFSNPTFVPFLLIWITHGIGGFGITFVLPTVIYELGISDTAISQLMTMPAYAAVFLILLSLGYLTHTKRLSPWVAGIGLEVGQIIFYILLITVDNATAKYIFVVIATAATQSFFPIIWPERIRATSGTTSAGLAIGLTNGATQLMGIVGPQVYQPKFGPSYKVSYSTSVGLLTVTVAMIGLTWFLVHMQDKRAEAAAIVESESASVAGEKDKAKPQGC